MWQSVSGSPPSPGARCSSAPALGVRPTSGAREPKHLLSEALPDVLSQQQALGSLVPLPAGPCPPGPPDAGARSLTKALDCTQRPLEGWGSPSGLSDRFGPELGAPDSSAEGSSGGSGPQPACSAGRARRTSLGLSVLHVTCVDLSPVRHPRPPPPARPS